jgi:hypothetical protein
MVLYPYKQDGLWVFDDAAAGLKEEPFVEGASEMISRLLASLDISSPDQGFSLIFGEEPRSEHDVVLRWTGADEVEGNWYEGVVAGDSMTCWLCPALLCYFKTPPRQIYVTAEPLPEGVDPIWHPAAGEQTRRFVKP